MKERPILFNTEMVRAVLDGGKTQTRRVMKIHDCVVLDSKSLRVDLLKTSSGLCAKFSDGVHFIPPLWVKCPYGQVGDQLWVRETFKGYSRGEWTPKFLYRASDPEAWPHLKWQPSIHMPREVSRIYLEIVDIRVERVQDITEEDARSEGVGLHSESHGHYKDYDYSLRNANRQLTAVESFYTLWESINKKRGFRWHVNPYVWVVEFKRIWRGNQAKE